MNIVIKKPLRKGVDYYLENGFIVLTRFYHLKRGKCCGSSCRHCPYGGEKGSRIIKDEQPD